jgi:hypothetical protein
MTNFYKISRSYCIGKVCGLCKYTNVLTCCWNIEHRFKHEERAFRYLRCPF